MGLLYRRYFRTAQIVQIVQAARTRRELIRLSSTEPHVRIGSLVAMRGMVANSEVRWCWLLLYRSLYLRHVPGRFRRRCGSQPGDRSGAGRRPASTCTPQVTSAQGAAVVDAQPSVAASQRLQLATVTGML